MRSRAGYWLAGLAIVLGLAAGGLFFAGAVGRLGDRVEDFVRVEVGETRDVELPRGDVSVFLETGDPDVTGAGAVTALRITPTGGRPLRLRDPTFDLTYSLGRRHGVRIAKTRVAAAGTHTIESTGVAGDLLIGEVPGLSDVNGILLGSLLAMLGLLVGALLAIVTAVRRNR